MDPREYHDARWHALLREAVDLGVPEDDAPALVQRVLDDHQRRIRRAEDPDPLVREALRDAVHPTPRRSPRGWLGVAGLVAALVVVGVAVVLTRPDRPLPDRLRADQVPSLFGYDGEHAQALLEERGMRVTVQPFQACEVYGRVVGSDPEPGTPYDAGDPVTVYTSLPADVACLTDYQQRATAWQLLDFANGRGPAPAFAGRVVVYSGGGGGPATVLDGRAARDPDAWGGTDVLEQLRTASQRVELVSEHPVSYAVPAITITATGAGTGRCGVPGPAVADAGDAFALLVRAPDRTGCPVRVEVYLDGDAIVAIALYPGSS